MGSLPKFPELVASSELWKIRREQSQNTTDHRATPGSGATQHFFLIGSYRRGSSDARP